MLGKEQRHLHSRILTNALFDDVLPVLKDDPRFPERADDQTNEGRHNDRMRIWQLFVHENPLLIQAFFAPLAESIAFDRVERRHNPDHEVIFRWSNEV